MTGAGGRRAGSSADGGGAGGEARLPIHPYHPARIRLRLEHTVPGCDWLLDRWDDLMLRLHRDDLWLSADAFKMTRLLGKHAIDMADDLTVARVFLSSLTLLSAPGAGPERESFDWKDAMIKMLLTFEVENKNGIAAATAKQCEPFARRLAELPLARLAPRDEEEARRRLTTIIEQEVFRLRHVRQALQAIADADAAEAPGRLAFEIGPEGDRQRRYGLSNERAVMRRFDQFLKTRATSETGLFDAVDVNVQDLLGTVQPHAEARSTIEPAEVNGLVSHENDARDRLEMATLRDVDQGLVAPSPEQKPSCDEQQILRNEANHDRDDVRNEAIADLGSVRNEASLEGGGQEMHAAPESGFYKTGNGHSCRARGTAEQSAHTNDQAEGNLEAMLDVEQMRREFKKRTPFRAERSRKRNENAPIAAEAVEAILRALQGEHENATSRHPPDQSIRIP